MHKTLQQQEKQNLNIEGLFEQARQQAINLKLSSRNHVETESSHIFQNIVTTIKLVSWHSELSIAKLH